jgi:ABC-type polysaccharide/polyol phosphate transport system ATPase subunit
MKQGEVVGIIGRNGAGKSTLPSMKLRARLKILSRITEPAEGRTETAISQLTSGYAQGRMDVPDTSRRRGLTGGEW